MNRIALFLLILTAAAGCSSSAGRTYQAQEWKPGRPLGKVLVVVPQYAAAAGNQPERWFTPIDSRDLSSSRKYPIANYAILALARLYGAALPWPERVPFDRAAHQGGTPQPDLARRCVRDRHADLPTRPRLVAVRTRVIAIELHQRVDEVAANRS